MRDSLNLFRFGETVIYNKNWLKLVTLENWVLRLIHNFATKKFPADNPDRLRFLKSRHGGTQTEIEPENSIQAENSSKIFYASFIKINKISIQKERKLKIQ